MPSFLEKVKREFSLNEDLWDPSNRFETSWCLSPYLLFAIRAAFSLYAFVTLFFIIVWDCTHNGDYDGDGKDDFKGCAGAGDDFSYFTVLSYWGIAFYFAFGAVHTFTYARYGRPLIDSFPRILKAAHSMLYTTILVFPLIVTIVFWALLYDPQRGWFSIEFEAWSNISQHIMNSAFAMFEILVPRTDLPPWAHIPFLVIMLALYLALAYVTEATKGFYTYSFLDPEADEKGPAGVAGYIIGILLACIVLYVIVKGLIWLRKLITEKKLGLDGKFVRQSARRADIGIAKAMQMK